MKKLFVIASVRVALACLYSCTQTAEKPAATGELDRTVLPILPPEDPFISEMDVRNATAPEQFKVTAPEGAPNVLLVLIDDRPVFDYFNGGTFWEQLPITIEEVERIEVIRGPSSALYGPNAVCGVVHIITMGIGIL